MTLKLVDKTNTSIVDLFFMFSMIIFAGSASAFVRGLGDYSQIGNIVGILISLVYVRIKKININDSMLSSMIGVFTVYAVINSLLFLHFSLTFYLRWYSLLFITFVLIKYYGKRILIYYETIVVFLCLCSIVIWTIYIFQPVLVKDILTSLRFSRSYSDTQDTLNALIFTLNEREFGEFRDWYFIDRNAGFAWEPGAFSCFICLAIFCNVLRTNFSIKNNIPLIILLVALITSQSTTGFSILFFMIVIWLFSNRKYQYGILCIPALLYMLSLPFMGDKIFTEMVTVSSLNEMDITMNRFQSFQIAMIDFMHYPLLGYGGGGQSYLSSIGFESNIASGIGLLMSQFGAIVTIFVFVLIGMSSNYYNKLYHSKNGYILWAVIIGLMFSYHIWNQPIIMSFWMGGALMAKFSNEKTI